MRKLTLALSTAALVLSGAAAAQTAPAERPARAAKPDMTRAQAQARAEAMFDRMDANRDGTLDEADRAAMKSAMFDRLDTDRNGAISPAELAARGGDRGGMGQHRMAKREGAPATTDAQKAERRAQMFARIDTDRNGSLSRAELDAMQAVRAGKDGQMGHRMGAGMEHGGAGGHEGMMKMDATTTRQAFVERALARFDTADANRDGTVTQAERKAARETMRQQWQAKRQQG